MLALTSDWLSGRAASRCGQVKKSRSPRTQP